VRHRPRGGCPALADALGREERRGRRGEDRKKKGGDERGLNWDRMGKLEDEMREYKRGHDTAVLGDAL
jgi:hypothetical protein